MTGPFISKGLTDKVLEEIRALEKVCCKHEKLNFKLNWDMLNRRPIDENNDFLYYEDDKLVGFLGLYCIGPNPKEIEATGMVHPDYRRKGIFTELFNAAKQECISRGSGRILLISERISDSGISFTKYIGAKYAFSEYRMKFGNTDVTSLQNTDISLRKASVEDKRDVAQLDALCFGVDDPEVEEDNNQADNEQDTIYIVELAGKMIGKIGVLIEDGEGYIFGFGIKPEYRGKGYGREVLNLTLSKLLSDNIGTVLLEVAVNNENALNLYKSCGFEVITVYDYYGIIL